MTPIQSFSAMAATWQNFYLLAGTAAATLVGLMFVAVTFGANLVDAQTTPTARAFLDPPFTHFVLVLVSACLMIAPSMNAALLGALILVITALRTLALVRTYRRMREAHQKFNDLELSDWLTGIVLPLVSYATLAASGVGFMKGYGVAFSVLAIAIVVIMLLGIFGAWELLIWMAIARARKASGPDTR